jgi:hypothetical protein
MSRRPWELLTTLFDMPSTTALADLLAAEGFDVRVVSEAHLFGQAAPCRVFVAAEQMRQARWMLSQRQFTDEELAQFAAASVADPAAPVAPEETTTHGRLPGESTSP